MMTIAGGSLYADITSEHRESEFQGVLRNEIYRTKFGSVSLSRKQYKTRQHTSGEK